MAEANNPANGEQPDTVPQPGTVISSQQPVSPATSPPSQSPTAVPGPATNPNSGPAQTAPNSQAPVAVQPAAVAPGQAPAPLESSPVADTNPAPAASPTNFEGPETQSLPTQADFETDPRAEFFDTPDTPFAQSEAVANQFDALQIPSRSAGGQADPDQQSVSWTASEFIQHDKSAGWYMALALVTAALAVVLYTLTKDMVTAIVVVIAGLLLGVYGARKPRQVQYTVDITGVTIGARQYDYSLFRSFAVIPEGAFSSIVLMPLKRFSPPLTLYYAPDDEEKIMNVLANQLPFENRKPDMTDRLMRKIRF